MAEITRSAMAQVGVDPSKRVFQVHAVDRAGRMLLAKAMSPDRFFAWCAELPAGCLVAMEACGGAHHVARRLRLLGLDARLVAGHFVTPYRMAGKSGKSDANDAAAICEAAGRPHMRFVPVKTTEQQGQLAVHRLREGFKEERTALINRIRSLLAEFGLVFAQSPEALRAVLADVIEDASNELPGVARLALQRVQLHWIDIELQMSWCDERIASHVRSDERACEESCHFAGLSARSPPRRWWPVWATSVSLPMRGSSAPGSGWCPARTPPAARPGWGASPNAATTTCAHCSSRGRSPR
jgi:transposase